MKNNYQNTITDPVDIKNVVRECHKQLFILVVEIINLNSATP